MGKRIISILISLTLITTTALAGTFKAGAAVRIITPDPLLPVSGGVGIPKPAIERKGDLFARALVLERGNTRVAMDMVQIFLDIGETENARDLFNKLPARDKESETGKSLIGQLTFADLAASTEGKEALQQKLAQTPDDDDARFDLAVCQVAAHDYNSAIDQLFALLQASPDYREGAAREMIITISNMLAPNDPGLAGKYRQRLANMMNE